jgi:diacylglycerol kinase (ATP)
MENNKDMTRKFSLNDRFLSVRNALTGLLVMVKSEHNFRIHLFVFLLVIAFGLIIGISTAEWLFIIFVSGLVFVMESMNTAIEYLSDVISPGYHEKVKKAKDVAAAGVLISAILSVITGILIFLPRIIRLITGH